MKISNQQIADLLLKFADIQEIYAENPYRIRAYRRAARAIIRLDKNIYDLVQAGEALTDIPTIGPGIQRHIHEIVRTNKIPEIFTYPGKEKPFRNELLQISGLGKKRISLLNDEGITTLVSLEESILNGNLKTKFKWATESFILKILDNIKHPKKYEKFLKYKTADLIIKYIQNELVSIPDIIEATPASNYRRKAELVGNVDWLLITKNDEKVIQSICELNIVREIVKRNKNSVSVILRSSLLMTFYFVKKDSYALSLLFHTGSAAHLDSLQMYANDKNKNLYGKSEKEIYNNLNLEYIEPELREDRGELLAAEKNKLPVLIELKDIKGDLHTHTNETDGVEPMEVMVKIAIQSGYEYYAITDHSKSLAITNGMDETRLLKQIELINELNLRYPQIKILKSMEVDILEDGSLDLSNEVLKELDIRVCSIHSRFKLPEDKQTERIIRAMDNPYFNILGHMTGRLLTSRPPYALQIEKIFKAAKDRNCFIELNAQPSRLDINDQYCKMAKEIGLKIAISSDAHSIRELSYIQFGINQARRGWLEKKDVINTRSLPDLLKLIKRS